MVLFIKLFFFTVLTISRQFGHSFDLFIQSDMHPPQYV